MQKFIGAFDINLLAHRLRLTIGESDVRLELVFRDHIEELLSAIPENNNWILERSGEFLKIKDCPEFQESFRMMTAEEFAGIDCSGVYPLKLRDAIWLLEEYMFFKL